MKIKYKIIILLALSFLFIQPIAISGCQEDSCIVSADGALISANTDTNFIALTQHNGIKSHNYDVNITILNPDKTYYVQNQSASQAVELGKWYYEVLGGFTTEGTYEAIWDSKNTDNGTQKSALLNFDVGGIDINAAVDVNTTITNNQCDIDLDADYYLGQYPIFTITGFEKDGAFISTPNLKIYKSGTLVYERNFTLVGDHFQHISNKKINDETYNLEITTTDCKKTFLLKK